MAHHLKKALEVFSQVCDLSEEKRNEVLASLDEAVSLEVQALLREDDEYASTLTGCLESLVECTLTDEIEEDFFRELVTETSSSKSRYHRRGEAGSGSYGTVYEVEDRRLGRTLAMKVLQTNPVASGEATAERRRQFLDEVRITSSLGAHPSVPSIYDMDVDEEGNLFFTMDWVEGEGLHQTLERVRRGEFTWSQNRLLSILLRICETVAFAHGQGVVHLDLKPSNIIVDPQGVVFILDWGVARANEIPTTEEQLRVGGTAQYMAPEQRNGRVDSRSDVYSIGLILYELLRGSPRTGPAHTRQG